MAIASTTRHTSKKLLDYLKQDLAERKDRNPSFSMRSYARYLKLSPTLLSRILNGKRKISKRSADQIVRRISLENPQIATQLSQSLPTEGHSNQEYTELDILQIDLLSEWFYFGVLSLAETKGFQGDPNWVAKRLGISKSQAKSALKNLEKLELLERNRSGQLVHSGKSVTTSDRIVSLSVRRMNIQSLSLAKDILHKMDEAVFNKTNYSGMTMAIDPQLLPEAHLRIKKFRRKLCDFLESGDRKEVYRLGIQLFPLSHEVDT